MAKSAVRVRGDIRERNGFILSSMTASHAIFHAFHQSLLIMLPNVRDTLALSDVQTTGIATVRQIAAGAIDLPGGVVMDLLKRHWGLIMAICTGGVAVGWLILGWAPIYPILLFGMAVVSASASLWHLPTMAALSHRFAERRGFALSVHGVGGNIGDILGPAVTGILLTVLAWREIISVYATVPLFATFLVFWAFKNIGRDGNNETDASITSALQNQLAYTKQMLKNRVLWGVILVAGLRGMAFAALTVILSLYTKDVLELSDKTRGFYFGLISLVGLVASPMLGHLSDRFGRKVVLVPNLICLSVCSFLIVRYGDSGALAVILAVIGIFLYSDQPILTAAALDVVGRNVTTTAVGIISFSRLALSAPSPIIAGWLYNPQAVHVVFYYIAALFGLSALILLLLPLTMSEEKV